MQSSKNSAFPVFGSKRTSGSAPKKGKSNYQNPVSSPRNGNSPAVSLAYSKAIKSGEPVIRGSRDSTKIHHRELIATINGSVNFANFGSYNINPGLASTFPWLSTQAAGWEQYRFHALKFEVVSRTAATVVGSIIMAPDYDPLDAPPATEIAAMSYRGASDDAPWKQQCVVLDPNAMFPIGPRKYIRSSSIAGSDLKTYDAGIMHLCTVGMVGADSVAKLYVEYDVELYVPQTQSANSAPSNLALSVYNLSANQSLTTGTAATLAVDEVVTNGLSLSNSSGALTLPAGNFLVTADVSVSGGSAVTSSASIELEKNGAAQAIPCLSRDGIIATGANTDYQLSLTSFVTSTGSDTIRLRVTYTSATGTLVARADSCRLVVLAV